LAVKTAVFQKRNAALAKRTAKFPEIANDTICKTTSLANVAKTSLFSRIETQKYLPQKLNLSE